MNSSFVAKKKSLGISVAIATYNRADLLSKVLQAFAKQTLTPDRFELIICDSQSSDSTSFLIDKFKQENTDIALSYYHTQNILASKRNLGVKMASYEIVVFLDDDCIPMPDFLAEHLSQFALNQGVAPKSVFCGEVRFPIEWVNKSNYYRYRNSLHFKGQAGMRLPYNNIVVMNMSFLRSDFLNSVGGVNEGFVGYGSEDIDLGWRLVKSGYELVSSRAAIIHNEPSANIFGYSKKLFHSSRDGARYLLECNQDAYQNLDWKYKLIDPTVKGSSFLVRFAQKAISILLSSRVAANLVMKYLLVTDQLSLLYSPLLYRYVTAYSYYQGAIARSSVRQNVAGNWYS
jgi:glycosyltransferase involved in cell wall biosynthesis